VKVYILQLDEGSVWQRKGWEVIGVYTLQSDAYKIANACIKNRLGRRGVDKFRFKGVIHASKGLKGDNHVWIRVQEFIVAEGGEHADRIEQINSR